MANPRKSACVREFLRKRFRGPLTYADRFRAEHDRFEEDFDINALPDIFHYWSNLHMRPMFEEFGVETMDDWFAIPLAECVEQDGGVRSVFASLGAGNCDTEVRVAKRLKEMGCGNFVIECLEMNDVMLARGKTLADAEGVGEFLEFTQADLNHWRAHRLYSAVMANQSLHHIMNLEGVFSEVKLALRHGGAFVISDMIGRNGHMRWPEALEPLQAFWNELPQAYRYNRSLDRHEEVYDNWDCSKEGFEGIRAQDILPLLVERFHFRKLIACGNVIDVFVDRPFGHNFDPASAWDRDFIDRVHAFDEAGFADGSLKPTHMFAVLSATQTQERQYSRGLSPEFCVRDPLVERPLSMSDSRVTAA